MYVSDELKKEVWLKTAQFQSFENDVNGFRKDQCGAWIRRSDYGNRDSIYGWEIDHIIPIANGGPDYLPNLRVLHRKNNLEKSNGRLVCSVSSHGTRNVVIN